MIFKKELSIILVGSLLSGNLAKASYNPECDFLASEKAIQERYLIYGEQDDDCLSLNENDYLGIMRNVFSVNDKSEDSSIEDECYMLKKSDQRSRFSGLLCGLNLSPKQTNLARLLQTKHNKQLESNFKIFIKICRSEKTDKSESYMYYFKIPTYFKNDLDNFLKNEDKQKELKEKIEKFAFFVNNVKNKLPISFSKSFICKMVFKDKKLDVSYFISNNNDNGYREVDYSKYSEDELSDLCKYFIYCIPEFVFDTINV